MDHVKTSFLSGENRPFIAHLYEVYIDTPEALPGAWYTFFASLGDPREDVRADGAGASWAVSSPSKEASLPATSQPAATSQRASQMAAASRAESGAAASSRAALPQDPSLGVGTSSMGANFSSSKALQDSLRDSLCAMELIQAYRALGHLAANLDPLGLKKKALPAASLDPIRYGFDAQGGSGTPLFLGGVFGGGGGEEGISLKQLQDKLHTIYCGTIGTEFMHLQDQAEKSWIQARVENQEYPLSMDGQRQREILQDLIRAESFERFLAIKYPAAKRFGLEGGESLIPGLCQALKRAGEHGREHVVLGMAHRGRLNVLFNILGFGGPRLFSLFQAESATPEDVQGSGDVKYHLGASGDNVFGTKKLHLSLVANPSHLESVNPVALGKVRAKQVQLQDKAREKVMGILIHGDASFAGQGIVAESLVLANLEGYSTGGTLHIIINNQIGFTTMPELSRSSAHCCDVAKMIQAPLFHVNGDDPEAVAQVMGLAIDFLCFFQKDVVVDLVCYRRNGHNEMDEPFFTQPLLYQAISKHPTTREIYEKALLEKGVVTESEVQAFLKTKQEQLQREFQEASAYVASKADWLEGSWTGLKAATPKTLSQEPVTGVAEDLLKEVGQDLARAPKSMSIHPKLKRFLASRQEVVEGKSPVDWALGEALAFGTLLVEGTPVRLSGQDSGRGTFTQRHAVLFDQSTGEKYISLNHLRSQKAAFDVIDSPLSEAAVLGFELGYSLVDPHTLVLWEAQFGDFANGAQVIIDQYIAACEAKWLRMSGLVLLLPHGYEGQGPEHSSSRLERYLQLCAEYNLQVVNCSTPANYFHVLRRQIHRPFRKPLIVMTPKSLLRHRAAVSPLKDMASGTAFRPVIGDKSTSPESVDRVVLCSGKVYYDLLAKRRDLKNDRVALVRLEQFYPFPEETLRQELLSYPKATFVWCQEESENNGAWTFLDRRLESLMKAMGLPQNRFSYAGRPESASPATGSQSRHLKEQESLITKALVG